LNEPFQRKKEKKLGKSPKVQIKIKTMKTLGKKKQMK
jgi:hypothetical protein